MRRLLSDLRFGAGVLFPRSRDRWLTVREVAVMAARALVCCDVDDEKYGNGAPGSDPGTPPERPTQVKGPRP